MASGEGRQLPGLVRAFLAAAAAASFRDPYVYLFFSSEGFHGFPRGLEMKVKET